MVVYYVVFFKVGILLTNNLFFCKLVNDDVFLCFYDGLLFYIFSKLVS